MQVARGIFVCARVCCVMALRRGVLLSFVSYAITFHGCSLASGHGLPHGAEVHITTGPGCSAISSFLYTAAVSAVLEVRLVYGPLHLEVGD